ncbi:MAG: cation diffusion facilitator family transporter [Candidatus Poribacteria bacterium]
MTPEDSERSSDERDGAPAAPRGESDAGPRDPKESLARRANRVRARLLALHVLLTVGKLAAGSALGSFALIADAANSLREVGASIPSLFVTRRIGKRRHARHPFDHGKIEAAALYGASFAILVLAGGFGVAAFLRVLTPHPAPGPGHPAPGPGLLALAGVSVGVSEGMFRMQRRLYAQLRSPALELNRSRRRTDMASGLTVLLGAVVVRLGGEAWWFCDDVAAMIVAVLVAYGAASTLWRPGFEVLDRAPRGDIAASVEVCARRFVDEGRLDVRSLVTRRLGSHVVVEARLLVPFDTTTGDGAALAARIREQILLVTPFVTDVVITVSPDARSRGPDAGPAA